MCLSVSFYFSLCLSRSRNSFHMGIWIAISILFARHVYWTLYARVRDCVRTIAQSHIQTYSGISTIRALRWPLRIIFNCLLAMCLSFCLLKIVIWFSLSLVSCPAIYHSHNGLDDCYLDLVHTAFEHRCMHWLVVRFSFANALQSMTGKRGNC